MDDSALYLGIDGGGTACRARLTDPGGRVLGEATGGAANTRLGVDQALAVAVATAKAALAAAGLAPTALGEVHAGVGLAGLCVGDDRAALLARAHPFAVLHASDDARIACLGAHGGDHGGIVILGTGSCAAARLAQGWVNLGGWGFRLSDQASGAAVGLAALRRALLAAEGLAVASPLTEALMARFDHRPDRAVVWAQRATPGDFGALAPLVAARAVAGDPVGRALLIAAGEDAAMLVRGLLRLGVEKIALLGGFAPVIAPYLPADLHACLVAARGDALDGALRLARGEGGAYD